MVLGPRFVKYLSKLGMLLEYSIQDVPSSPYKSYDSPGLLTLRRTRLCLSEVLPLMVYWVLSTLFQFRFSVSCLLSGLCTFRVCTLCCVIQTFYVCRPTPDRIPTYYSCFTVSYTYFSIRTRSSNF